jgi:hypothetical protein
MTDAQFIAFIFDPAILPGRDGDEQALWAAYLLSIVRLGAGGVC